MICGAPFRDTFGVGAMTWSMVSCAKDQHERTESHVSDWVYPHHPATPAGPARPSAIGAVRLEWWDAS